MSYIKLLKLEAEIDRIIDKEKDLLAEKEILERSMRSEDWLSKLKLEEIDNSITYVRERLERALEKKNELELEKTKERSRELER